jgi:hypothetical protein
MANNDKELKGLEEVVELLVEKMTVLRKESVIASDPNLKFQLKKQIEDLYQELDQTKQLIHQLQKKKINIQSKQCSGTTRLGKRCKNRTKSPNGKCHLHS